MKYLSPDVRIDETMTVGSLNIRSRCSAQYKMLLFFKLLATRDVAEFCRVHHEITHNAGKLPKHIKKDLHGF